MVGNADEDIIDNVFVDSGYTLDGDDGGAIDETIVDTILREVERGEGFGNSGVRDNQHFEEIVDANVVKDVPLNNGRENLDGLHNIDESGSKVDEKIIYLMFNEEVDKDDLKFEKWLKFRDVTLLRDAVWSHSIRHGAHSIWLKKNERSTMMFMKTQLGHMIVQGF